MKKLDLILVIISAVLFILGGISKVTGTELLWSPAFFWRGAMALGMYAAILILMQIRNK